MKISLFAVVSALMLVAVTEALPSDFRVKRDTTSAATSTLELSSASSPSPSSSSAAATAQATEAESASTSSTSSSTTRPPPRNEFGIGAAAGIGGLTRAVGLGNFNPDVVKSDAFAPWGAYAGINLGDGGRIGAGCSGLNCGVQLGHLVLGTPHLFGLGRNLLNPQRNNGPEAKKGVDEAQASSSDQSLSTTVGGGAAGNVNSNGNGNGNPEENIRVIFRDAFRGFRETLQSFFRAPVTHFIKKHVRIDNSTESAVGPVKSSSPAEQKTYRIQLTPHVQPTATTVADETSSTNKNDRENELD